jgi:hypothetical protein
VREFTQVCCRQEVQRHSRGLIVCAFNAAAGAAAAQCVSSHRCALDKECMHDSMALQMRLVMLTYVCYSHLRLANHSERVRAFLHGFAMPLNLISYG